MMKYRHRFTVQAPLEAVADFHSRSDSMGAITPPPVIAQVHQAPPQLSEGDEMDFTLWFGPVQLRWLARIEDVVRDQGGDNGQATGGDHHGRRTRSAAAGFSDRQLRGPFAHWLHRHTFKAVDETTTEVIDEIEFKLRSHPLWRLVGLGMYLNLPLLFAYRGWKTRQLLEAK